MIHFCVEPMPSVYGPATVTVALVKYTSWPNAPLVNTSPGAVPVTEALKGNRTGAGTAEWAEHLVGKQIAVPGAIYVDEREFADI